MRGSLHVLLAVSTFIAGVVPPAGPVHAQQVGGITAEQVQNAIRQGIEYLLNEQSGRGMWDEMAEYPGGVTSLVTLALLTAGVEPSHPKMQKSLDHIRGLKLEKTYTVALQTMALAAGEPRRDLPLIQANANWLQRVQIKMGERAGSWSYGEAPVIAGDNSNTQFAVLGLHEAERAGARVDPEVWKLAADYYRKTQNPDGSWGYQPQLNGTGSMTSAGIGAWVICSERVADPTARIENGAPQCCLPPPRDDVLEQAVVWMGRNFSVQRNPGAGSGGGLWHLYYLYALERVGRLTARRFLGEHDWFREGAELLVSQQDPFSHHWQGRGHAEDNPHIATALALLFLSKGRRPILIAKLRHGPEDDWNNHRTDMAELTSLAEQQWDLEMTWQLMDPQPARVEDLLQAPVLFLSGSKQPQLAGLEEKVRAYLDRGGFLFVEACCMDGTGFSAGFRQFIERVFPEGEYRLRRAGPEHPIWRIDRLVRPESAYVGRLWTIEYGCRTCVVFSEVDLSCYWELGGQGRTEVLPEHVQERIDDASSVGLNVLAYATNREPKGKEQSFASLDASSLDALASRGVIRVAKLIHGGGCNDAPGALVNLLRAAAQGDRKLQISTQQFDLLASDPSLPRFHLAFMHGRHDFRFTDEERVKLREYLANGGTLFADAICASKEFAAAFRREIQLVLPDQKLERIAADHPLLTAAAGGYDIRQVSRREPAAQQAGQPLRSRVQKVAPELEGVMIDGRLAVIFSPYDVSCALEQHEALQCRGYTREDAARIGLNVLMYSLNPDAGAAPDAAP